MSSLRSTPVLITCCCALLVAGCGGGGASSDAPVVSEARAPEPASEQHAGGVLVDVAGHVRTPGVYRLDAGARVHDAIEAAGGARRGANLAALNRAAPLVDGQQVLVGSAAAGDSGGASAGAATGGGAGAGGGLVSLNSADAAALDALPGIGPVTAERIIAEREASGPFASVDDLDRVSGIGPATIESLREVVTT